MDASKKQREPVAFKSLAELKRFIRPGVEFKTVSHANHADMVGLTRVVTTVQPVGFYSKIKDQPEHPFSTCNHGKGFYAASREPRRGETPVTRASAVPDAALAWGSSVEYRQQRKSKKAAPQGAVPPRYGAAFSALRQKYGDRPPPLSFFRHPRSSLFQTSERPAFTPPYPPDDPHICAARYDSKNRRALP